MNRRSCNIVLAAVCLVAGWGGAARASDPRPGRVQQAVRTATTLVAVPVDGGVFSPFSGECVVFSGEAIAEVGVQFADTGAGGTAGSGTIQVLVDWRGLDGAGLRTVTEYAGFGVSQFSFPFTTLANGFQTSFRAPFDLAPLDPFPADVRLRNRPLRNGPPVGCVPVNPLVELTVRPSGIVFVRIRVPQDTCQPSPFQRAPIVP